MGEKLINPKFNVYKQYRQMNLVNPYIIGSSYDVDAQSFISAAGLTNIAQKNAINQLVIDLKTYGLWSKMKAIYPIVGGTSFTHKFNLKDPRDLDAAYRLNFGTNITHSSTGAKPTGAGCTSNTFLSPNSISQNSAHLSYYSRTSEAAATKGEIGANASSGATDFLLCIMWNAGLGNLSRLNTAYSGSAYVGTKTYGFFLISRISSNVTKLYEDSVLKNTLSTTSGVASTKTVTLFSASGSYETTKECAFATIGDGLNDSESLNLYNIIQNFQISLGRNV